MTLRGFYPRPHFVPVSLSGVSCHLQCQHCGGHYLKAMTAATSPDELWHLSQKIEQIGGLGMLVSGGSDSKGRMLNLSGMLDVLRHIKTRGKLIIAIHPGLVSEQMAGELVDACHVAFADMVGDETTIRQIIGVGTVEEYVANIQRLAEAGIPVTPHLTVGLHYGNIKGEYRALSLLDWLPPCKIVINVICSTAGTKFASLSPPDVESVKGVVAWCVQQGWHPALGCMRPRGRPDFEYAAIDAGVKDIALPSKSLVNSLKEQGSEVEIWPVCCGLPNKILDSFQQKICSRPCEFL